MVFAAEHEHSSHDHDKPAIELTLNNGAKWSVDPVMNANMRKIKEEFHRVHTLFDKKKSTQKDFNLLAGVIESATNEMIKSCKLEPAADKTFHVVLFKLLENSKELKTGSDSKRALIGIHEALNLYPKYFDHKNW